jgi:hypothetical protein
MSGFPAAASGTPDTGKTVNWFASRSAGTGMLRSHTWTKAEMEFSISTVTVSELCDDLLRHIQASPMFTRIRETAIPNQSDQETLRTSARLNNQTIRDHGLA